MLTCEEMEKLMQGVSIEDISQFLEDGKSISKVQFEILQNECKDQNKRAKYREIFKLNTKNVLQALEGYGKLASTLVLSLIDSETFASLALEASKDKINSNTQDLLFYIGLCLNICLRYPKVAFNVFSNLLQLLAAKDRTIHATVVLTLVTVSRQNAEQSAKQVASFIESIIDRNPDNITTTDYFVVCSAFETFFAIFPAQMKSVYVGENCKRAMIAADSKLLLKEEEGLEMAKKILKAAALSCVDEEARKFNTQNYLDFFIAGTNALDMAIVSLSLLCIVKIWNFSAIQQKISMQKVLAQLQQALSECDSKEECAGSLLEALSYLSLGKAVKKGLREDRELLEKLLLILETASDSSVVYGVLVIFQNLSEIKDKSQDATMNYLKSVSSPTKNETENDVESVKLFNKSLVTDFKLVGTLTGLDQKTSLVTQSVQIIYNLTQADKVTVGKIVQQGGYKIIMKYLIDHSVVREGTNKTQATSSSAAVLSIRLKAIRALAVICRSVNPKLLGSQYDIKTPVPFLVELFGPEIAEATLPMQASDTILTFGNALTPFDTFSALLALTNIAADPNESLQQMIVNRTFEQYLKDTMIENSYPNIQRATWELFNNLASERAVLAKFFNIDNPASMKNLDVLLKLMHSQDVHVQVPVFGVLAISTMFYDAVCFILMSEKAGVFDRLLKSICEILKTQVSNNSLMERLFTLLINLVDRAEMSEPEIMQQIQNLAALKDALRTARRMNERPDVAMSIDGFIAHAGIRL